jgi:hypothetical protein
MGKIKVVVVDGLDADDVLKLKHGGFFDGVSVPLPPGATGVEARIVKKQEPATVVADAMPSVGGYDANVRDAVEKSEAAQLAVVEAVKQKVEGELFPHDPPQPEQTARRKKAAAEDRAVERAANKADEQPVVEQPAPVGNGKKIAVMHARQNGQYIVSVFGKKFAATYIARTKAGYSFKLENYNGNADVVTLSEGDIVEELSVDGAAPPSDEQAQDTADVDLSIDALLGFTKLRDLIQYVVSTGIHPTGVAAFCESMKNEVPLLQRISNIEERVTRTLEVMGLTEGK